MILNSFGPNENSDLIFEIQKVGNEWLTSAEAAQFLKVSPNALRIMVCRGQIKYFKIGRRLRFRAEDLEVLLRKGA